MPPRTPPGSGIVTPPATFDSGTVKFQYYNDGGPVDGGGSPSTFAVPGSVKFYNHFTVTVSGNQIIFYYLHKTRWAPSITSLFVPGPPDDTHALWIGNGVLISSVALIPSFTNVTLDPSSTTGNIPLDGFPNGITWSSDAIAVDWGLGPMGVGATFAAGDKIILNVSSTDLVAALPSGSGHPNT